MAKGEIIINEEMCLGCGICIEFCKQGCIALSTEKFTESGLPTAVFIQPDKCNACCVCGWMCPEFAIEIYKYVGVLG